MNHKLIKQLREQVEPSRRKFAESIGVDHAYIARIEKGTAQPSIAVLSKIAEGIGVPIKLFF